MEMRAWRAGIVLLLVVVHTAAAAAAPEACARVSAADSILGPPEGTCSALDDQAHGENPIGVVEGEEVALQRALNLVNKNKGKYVAVLFYASWCPFSKLCRANFNSLSSLFPSIRHFAFEESVIRPSILSRYGVHGFPTLFVLNSTMRVRYRGSRTITSLATFYSNVTGVKPSLLNPTFAEEVVEQDEGVEQENCPFPWASSPEKLLQQDTYLALASAFVLMRLLYHLLPRLNACGKRAWRRYTSLMSLRACIEHALNQLNPCKRRSNLQDGAMNARAWASKSLASVSIGEPSPGGERR